MKLSHWNSNRKNGGLLGACLIPGILTTSNLDKTSMVGVVCKKGGLKRVGFVDFGV